MDNSAPTAKQGLWAHIDDIESAKKAAHQGAYAAWFCAGVTLLLVLVNMMFFADEPFLGIGSAALFDVLILGGVGLGIYNFYRSAAVAGLLIYWAEQGWAIAEHGRTNWIMLGILTIAFINGIRGCYAFQEFKGSTPPRPPKARPSPTSLSEMSPKLEPLGTMMAPPNPYDKPSSPPLSTKKVVK